ncbi:hypothetical protein [Kitasatospora aureofaciens]|uniref:hypothetical protein n=1 Tax=Kitasatospora aureofaciens TaxID=1894 RepID=UPI0033DD6AAC
MPQERRRLLRGPAGPLVRAGLGGRRRCLRSGDLTTAGAIKRGGQAVVAAFDGASLESPYFSGTFLNGSGKQSHSDNSGVSGPAAFYRSCEGASKFKIAHR